jgi:hypothetical protein
MADIKAGNGRDGARQRAQSYFTRSEQRDTQVKLEIARERAAGDEKTAKLRALRLAKEEDDRIAAVNAPPPPAKRRAKKIKIISAS